MNPLRIMRNKFAKDCCVCRAAVEEQRGWAVGRYNTAAQRYDWATYCTSSVCVPRDAQQAAADYYGRRRLTADGVIDMPYEPGAVDIIKQMPGRRFVGKEFGGPYWTVSLALQDRAKVLHFARILKLDVDPSLIVATEDEDNPSVPVASKVPVALVNAAIERAKAAGAYPYQQLGVKFLVENKKCLLGDSMGLGKTLQALISIDDSHGALIIVPASVKFNWVNECKRWRPDLKPKALSGKQVPSTVYPPPGWVYIANYDILPDDLLPPDKRGPKAPPPQQWTKPAHPLTIIADEAHAFKNTATKRYKVMKSWGDIADRFVIMTGTPLTNRPPDLWGVLSVAGLAGIVFENKGKFNRLFGKSAAGGGEWGMPHPSVPALLRRVMLRRTQEEVLPELPPYTEKVHRCSSDPDPDLIEALDACYEEVKEELDRGELPDITRMSKVRAMLAKAKVGEMLELVEEYEEAETPLVVFSAHKAPCQVVAKRPGWALITGETKMEERQAIVEQFQRGELKGLALTIAAGGVGITLTRAAHMLFVDLDWTPAWNHQAMCRIRRIGQKAEHLHYVRMSFNHELDQRVEDLLAWKTELFRRTVDLATDELALQTAIQEKEDAKRLDLPDVHYVPPTRELFNAESYADREARRLQNITEKLQGHVQAMRTITDEQLVAYEERRQQRMAARREAERDTWLESVRRTTPPFVTNCLADRHLLKQVLLHMLGQCDGAHTKDDLGFNATDAVKARMLAQVDLAADDAFAEIAASILFKYRRQITAAFPTVYFGEKAPTNT